MCIRDSDTTVLLGGTGQEAGNIYQGEQRNAEGIAGTDKACSLIGAVDIHAAGHGLGLVGDNTNGAAIEAGKTGNHIGGIHAPVSYTHLDVYKRQAGNRDERQVDLGISLEGGSEGGGIVRSAAALLLLIQLLLQSFERDVYKRQAVPLVPALLSISRSNSESCAISLNKRECPDEGHLSLIHL